MKNNSHLQNKLILTLVFLFYTLFSFSQTSQTFGTSSTSGPFTFTAPAGVTSVTAQLWGAGGGGSSRGGVAGAASGGGGGAYTRSAAQAVTAGTSYLGTVGAGGTIGTPTAAPGNFSRISFGSNITANGGLSNNTNTRTGGAGGIAQTVGGIIAAAWRGGTGGGARAATGGSSDGNEAGGGGGGSALTTAIGGTGGLGNGVVDVATLGGTGTGAGGQGACPNDGDPDATAGIFPGGGGGGRGEDNTALGFTGGTSKTGANGRVIVSWTCPTYALTSAATSTGPFCGASTSLVTLRSTSLVTSGNYLVTYDLTGATASSGNTATMSFNATTDLGTFTTATLNAGTTIITITSIASFLGGFVACSTPIINFNTTSVTVNTTPTAVAGTAITTCSTVGAVNITAGSSATNQASITWTSTGTGTFTNPTSLTSCTYEPSPADILAGSVTLTLTAIGIAPCSDVTNTKTLTISQPMTSDAGTAIITCSDSGAVNITSGSTATNQTSITWTSSGTGTFTDANSLTTCTYEPSIADIAAGSVTLTLTASNGGCTDVIATKTLTITALPTAIAGSDFAICSDAGAVNITAGSSATNYSGVFWVSNGTGTFVNETSLTTCTYEPSVADIAVGSVTLRLTATANAPCADVGSTKILTISSPMTADAGTAIATCANSGAVNIITGASATNQTSIIWTTSGTGTFANADSLTTCTYEPSVADIALGSVTLSLTASNAACADVIATKTLTINPQPTAIAGTAITTCANSGAVNITAGSSATNQTSITWTSSGTGTFVNDNSLISCTYEPSVADSTAGSVTLTLTSNANAPCANVMATKTLTINALPTADAGTTITTCSNSGAVNISAGSSATNQTGILWSSSGTGTFVNETSLTTCTYEPSVADIASGSIILTLTASNVACADVIATKTLIINTLPTAAAGTAITTCSNSGAVNITTGSSATNYLTTTWTSSGTGTFVNETSLTTCTYTPSVADISSGSVTLSLTASNAGCTNVIATKTLTINALPTAVSGTAISTCSNSGAVNITAGSSATNYSTITWTSSGSGTFANTNSLTTCTYESGPADIAAGSVILTLTANGNTPCANVVSTKTLTITTLPTAIAGTAITTCSNSGAINITAGSSATNQTSVTWTSNGTGIFANANSLTNCTYNPSVADIASGSITLTLTASNVGCTNVIATKTLTITALPTAVAGTAINTCSNSGAVNITAGSSATNYLTTTWTSSGSGTFDNANSLTTCTYTPSGADIASGSVTLTLTATNTGCSDVTATKTLTISNPMTAVAGSTITTCSNSGAVNITSGSSATNQTSITWTSNGTGIFANANSLTTCTYNPSVADIASGSITLTLNALNSGCTNVITTKTLTITALSTAIAGTVINTCSNSGAVNITAGSSATNYLTTTWTSSGSGTFANANSLTTCTYTPSGADIASGSITLTLTATNTGCADVTATKTLTISNPMTAVAGSTITTCSNSGAVNITSGSSATNQTSVTWTSSGTGTFTNTNSLTTCTYAPSIADIAASSVTLTLTASNAGCANVTDSRVLTILSSSSATAGTDISTCSNSGAVNITAGASVPSLTTIVWSSNGTGAFTNETSLTNCTYNPSVADIASGSIIITLTASNPSCSVISTKILTINTLPTAIAGTAITTCSASGTINITAGSSATNQTSILWTTSGSGTFANANSLTTCTYTPSVADNTAGNVTLTLTANGNAPCSNVTSTKTVTINPLVTAITVGSNQTANTNSGICTALILVSDVVFNTNCSTSTIAFTLSGATTLSSTAGQVGNYTFNKGVTTINYTVTHFNGTTSTGSKTITITDITAPTLSAGANQSVNTDSGVCTASVIVTDATFGDNCSGSTISYTLAGVTTKALTAGQVGTYTFNKGITIINYTVTDSSNITTTGSKTITVTDNSAPTLTSGTNQTANTDTGICTASVSVANAVFGDNCSGETLSYTLTGATTKSLTSGQVGTFTFNRGITTINYTVTDSSNITTTGSKTITVSDNTPPTLTAGANQAVNTGAGVCIASVAVTNATFGDNCSGSTISYTLSGATTRVLTSGQVGTYTFNLGTTTINYTVTDSSNNITIGSKTITVTDVTLPTLTVGSNQNANTDPGVCTASVGVANATFGDNCSVTISYTLSGATVKALTLGQVGTHTFNKGVTTINYTVTDSSNNSVSDFKTITVVDAELPTITSLPTITQDCSVTIAVAPTSPDNCGTVTGITSDITLPFTYDIPGFYIIGWNFTDTAGNFKNISQTIIVTDINAPVPTLASLPTVSRTGCELLSSQLTYPTAMDNCNGVITGIPDIIFPYTILGTSSILWSFTDDTGNISYQEQTVIMTPENIVGGTVKGYVTSAGIAAATTEISITACASGGNEVKMDLSGQIGTVIQWEKYEAGDKIWVTIPNTTSTYTVTFLPSSTESTYFRALVNVGTCYQYSSNFYVRALPADQPPVLDQNLYNICLNQQVTLVARRGYTINEDAIAGQGGDFNQGQLNTQDPDSWLVDGNPGGFTAGANNTKPRNWSGTNNQQFGAITYDSQEFKFTMSCGNHTITTGANRYTGANPTTLESPIFSLTGLSAASVDFDQAYYFATGDTAIIYISINGGATYSVLKSLHTPGQPILKWFTDPTVTAAQKVGATATVYNFKNDNTSIPLTAYLGNSEVRIKWTFRGTDANSAWAMDGITIPVKPKLDTIEWTDGIGNPGVPPISLGQLESSFTYIPEAPGSHEYGATVLVDGCRSYDESGAALAEVNVNYAYAGTNITLTPDECGANSVKLNAYDNSKTANQNATKGAYTIPSGCITCDDPGTNTIGTWSITGSNTCGTGTFSNINDPDATFTAEVGTYTLSWVVFGCSSSVTVSITNCDKINFDGTNDYIDFKKENYNMSGDFSIEAWVKTAETSNSVQTIFSKRNGNVNGNGYDLRIQNDYVTFRWNGTGSMTSPNKINPNKWHHVAVTYTNSGYKLYIDGILLDTKTGATTPISNNYKSLLGAMDQDNNAPNNPINYFNGAIDEFKIWNVALSEEQIHQMMNQEIKEQSTGNNVVYGEVLPIVINGLSWSSLRAYYRMNNINCGYLNPNFGVGLNGKLKNTTIAEEQTAPLPYYTVRNGDWNNTTASSPWAYGNTVWNYPNSAGINGQFVNWNIVRTLHDINSTAQDIILLGLKVESGKITMTNPSQSQDDNNSGQGLWITHYLKLDGFVDLVGKSQLLQKKYNASQLGESILDVTSSGYIERDQKGQKNHFNYNYWSSPVSPINSTSNNTNYSVSGVMKDGTTSTPHSINWIGGLNGAPTTPISLARRWLYKFDNYANAYANWVQISENDAIRVGQGYIFKGTGTTTTNQNYTFKGKPNNGTIATNSVSSDQLLLTGNPYPSALNANKFISDNINSIDGTLYFWEHYSSNDTHILRDYQGGYATRNLTGGVAPVAPALISGRGSSSKTPNQFIPVGQSFFVNGKIGSGGTITYNNEQRGFYKENESGLSNTLFKTTESTKKLNSANQNIIGIDFEEIDTYMRIRLGFNSNNNYHRQLLLGFMNEKATSGIDSGYDALNFDCYPNDMYFLNGENQLVIQGESFFDVDSTYTLGVKTAVEGPVSFIIDALENFDQDQEIYIYDKLNDSYHDIRHEKFEVNLPAGTNHTRFSLRFINSKTLSNEDNILETDAIQIKHFKEENMLVINNNRLDTTVEKVLIYNLLGQNIASMKVENQDQKNIQLPIKSISAGVYIAKIKSSNGNISKKFIIN